MRNTTRRWSARWPSRPHARDELIMIATHAGSFTVLIKAPPLIHPHLGTTLWTGVGSCERHRAGRHHPPLAHTVHDWARSLSTPHRATRPVPMRPVHTTHSTYYCY
jgi:hypothetical protein